MKVFTTNGRINPNILAIAAWAAKHSKCSMPKLRSIEALDRVARLLDQRLAVRKEQK